MDNPDSNKKNPHEKELETLVELQKFLVDELGDSEAGLQFGKAFMPITSGLGLDEISTKSTLSSKIEEEKIPHPKPKESFMAAPLEVKESPLSAAFRKTTSNPPPPIPKAYSYQSGLAWFLDMFFVSFLTLVFIFISARLTHVGSFHFPADFASKFLNKGFVQLSILQYAMIWVCYLVVCFGILDRTFGMWVWGLRVSYGDESHVIRKILRIAWAIFLFPTLIFGLIVWIRIAGKDLLDYLSHSHVLADLKRS